MDTQVVHIDFEPFFSYHVGEDMIHECLEGGWSIAKPEKHDHGFIEAKGSDECGFPLVFLSDANVVVTPSYIESGEEGRFLHVIN